jgi:hypothetical protein
MTIPPGVRSIYILSEPPTRGCIQRNQNGAEVNNTGGCRRIMSSLVDFLSDEYPEAFIGVYSGGHLLDAMVQMAKAPTVITAPSTFSLWPMLANSGGNSHLYFVQSKLVLSFAPVYIADNFHWVNFPRVMNFGNLNYSALEGENQMIAALKGFPQRSQWVMYETAQEKKMSRSAGTHFSRDRFKSSRMKFRIFDRSKH